MWPNWEYLPNWVARDEPDLLSQQIHDHIREAVKTYDGEIAEWDVVNEPYSTHDAMDLLCQRAMTKWFAAARERCPSVKLYINDWGIYLECAATCDDLVDTCATRNLNVAAAPVIATRGETDAQDAQDA